MRPLAASGAFTAAGGPAERMGVFVGIQQMEYGALAAAHLGSTGAFTTTGTPFSVAAGRLSFHYGLKGPSLSAVIPATHAEHNMHMGHFWRRCMPRMFSLPSPRRSYDIRDCAIPGVWIV